MASRAEIIRFGVDGWHARFDAGFTDEAVARVAASLGELWSKAYPGGTVYVGYDTRHCGAKFARTAAEVLASFGLRALLSDRPCPTPAVAWACSRDDGAVGVMMLTASELSCEYGGIVVRGEDGGPVPRRFLEAVEEQIRSAAPESRGTAETVDVIGPYCDELVARVDAAGIRRAGLRVSIDPMYGSGGEALVRVLRDLGCQVTNVHPDVREDFGGIHPEPANPWADDCEQSVITMGSDLGILIDGDGDRAAIVDAEGNILLPHELSPLVLGHLVENRGERGRVVATLTCSARVERQAERLDCPYTGVPVGFSRVYREMLDDDVILGVEEYGGMAFPAHLRERDGLLAALLVVELVAQTGKGVRALVSEMSDKIGRMRYTRRDIHLDSAATQAFRNILPGLNPATVAGRVPVEVSHADGLRLKFEDDSWVMMRPSRADSVVRVYSEAPNEDERDELLDASCGIVRAGA